MKPRLKVIVTLHNCGNVLMAEVSDPFDSSKFFIPLGGGLEFGETLEQCAIREVYEEVSLKIKSPQLISFIENQFKFNGKDGHEVVFHFWAEVSDQQREMMPNVCVESDGKEFPIHWFGSHELEKNRYLCVPGEIVDQILSKISNQ